MNIQTVNQPKKSSAHKNAFEKCMRSNYIRYFYANNVVTINQNHGYFSFVLLISHSNHNYGYKISPVAFIQNIIEPRTVLLLRSVVPNYIQSCQTNNILQLKFCLLKKIQFCYKTKISIIFNIHKTTSIGFVNVNVYSCKFRLGGLIFYFSITYQI